MKKFIITTILFTTINLYSQINSFPYFQNFDSLSIVPPGLPGGWSSTQNRTPGVNDFTTTTGTVYSPPHCVISTNAKIRQILYSPIFNFTNFEVDSIYFFERRSSTYDSGVLLEASIDGGISYNIIIGDTLKYPGHTNYFKRKFKLPETISYKNNVKFRWNILGNGSGATATIRFDDILITTKRKIDLGIISIRSNPIYPTAGDSILILATLKNFGDQSVQKFNLHFFIDFNYDSIPQTNELFETLNVDTNLNKNDTMVTKFFLPWQNNPSLQIIIKIDLEDDEDLLNNIIVFRITYGLKRGTIVINEIMYRPTSPEPEWVELTNTTTDSINILNWKISDSKISSKYTITSINYFIKPKEFIIITKDSSAFIETRPYTKCRIFNVPNLPALNNDSDAVVIFDSRGGVIDSVYYRYYWGGSGGKSLERINTLEISTLRSNWGTSTHPEGCTPGKTNSLSQKDYDLKIFKPVFDPNLPFIGDEVLMNVLVKNIGKNIVNNISIIIFDDKNLDSLTQSEEMIFQRHFEIFLLPNDSLSISTNYLIDSVKEFAFIAKVICEEDEDTLNNINIGKLISGFRNGTIVINEIMYAPVGGEPEWIELFNTSKYSVNLKEWKLSNRNSISKYKLTAIDQFLLPESFAIVTKDTALFYNYRQDLNCLIIEAKALPTYLFNNSADAVVLFDNRNVQMDSVYYNSLWGGLNGFSLERIEALESSLDSANWGSSMDSTGCTPGRRNYLTPLDFDLKLERVDIDTLNNHREAKFAVVVKNAGKQPVNNFTIKVYFDQNNDTIPHPDELIFLKEVNENLFYKDTLRIDCNWHNPGSGTKKLISLIDYSDDMRFKNNIKIFTMNIGYIEKSLVINEIMYQPFTNLCEYVELYNRSKFPVELRYWKLHDWTEGDKVKYNEFKFGNTNLVLNPGEFVVLSADSSIFLQFPYLLDTIYKIIVFNRTSLSLNNEGDKIIVRDLLGNLIDSVCYTPGWHNPEIKDVAGRSLERINPELESNDSRNWSTCVNSIGGTPGKQNSIFTTTLPQTGELSFSPNPFSPDADGFEDYCIVSFNLPSSVSMVNVKIFDSKGRLVRTLSNNEPASSQGKLIWDGMSDEKTRVSMGIYIVLLEAYDIQGRSVNKLKGVVVVGGRL